MSGCSSSRQDIVFDEDVDVVHSGSPEDIEFDKTVGAIEEVLMEEDFCDAQNSFCIQHCAKFEDNDENKLIYTELFEDYTNLLENLLDRKLREKIHGFSMARFESMLIHRKDELSSDIFDMLMSFSDFNEFKDLMLSYKRSQSSKHAIDGFSIAGKRV